MQNPNGRKPTTPPDTTEAAASASADGGPRVLALDLAPGILDALREDFGGACIAARFEELTLQFLAQVMPDTVLAPLLGSNFDILDLVDRLAKIGFGGALRALTPPLPDLDAVRAEVRSHAAGLDFDLIILPDAGRVNG
ncbi:hypothetical protein [Defluviimonas sp. SAOS-178_SWC]|uniref:hypothetical protein n=1 Tax=Defluviimonas sp. SAOS-178_SWC TaxID=3121287 RepID=UPI003222151B